MLIGYGPVLLPQAWHAAELLERRHGVHVAVINLPWLNRVDGDWLHRTVSGVPIVLSEPDSASARAFVAAAEQAAAQISIASYKRPIPLTPV